MKKVLFILLSLVSCRNTSHNINQNPEGQLVLNFEAQSASIFFSDKIFSEISITPLETAENCLIGREPIELLTDQRHYFIKDNQQKVIFRFDKAGKFMNPIGRHGMGPDDYLNIEDFDIDPAANRVEILDREGKIIRHDYDGKFISKQNYDASLLSFIRTGANYWFFAEGINGDERLMKVSEDGEVIAKYIPAKTNWQPVAERNFERCGDIITFRDFFSHKVYHITDDGPVEKTVIDFGKYAIPERLYKMEMADAIEEFENGDYALIIKFIENEQYIYLYFYLLLKSNPVNEEYLWLVNKKTGNSVMQKFMPDDPLYEMIGSAKTLTPANELIFMADAQLMKSCTDPFFHTADSIISTLPDDSNPVIITLKINDF